MTQGQTIVWITGATKGLGAGLARTCPFQNARVINASRTSHPDLENIFFDLGDRDSWQALRHSFQEELADFAGERAIFIHNALFDGSTGFAGEMNEDLYERDVLGNVVAPLQLGDWFLRAVRSGYESGLVMISSAAAQMPVEGHSVYGAAKAAVEQWVRVVRRERMRRGSGPWVVAIRPGFVDSETTRREATLDPEHYPMALLLKDGLEAGEALHPDDAARNIWNALPPGDRSVLLFGEPPSGVGRARTGAA